MYGGNGKTGQLATLHVQEGARTEHELSLIPQNMEVPTVSTYHVIQSKRMKIVIHKHKNATATSLAQVTIIVFC